MPLDEHLRSRIAHHADERGLSWRSIPSGAGHDSQIVARLAPTAMVFVPSIGGSHNPTEHATWQAVENGANLLLDTLVEAARS